MQYAKKEKKSQRDVRREKGRCGHKLGVIVPFLLQAEQLFVVDGGLSADLTSEVSVAQIPDSLGCQDSGLEVIARSLHFVLLSNWLRLLSHSSCSRWETPSGG